MLDVKLATIVGRTKLTTLETIDEARREKEKSTKFEIWDQVPEEVKLFLMIPKFPYNTM